MGDDVVHGIIMTLIANKISVEHIHGSTKTRNSFGQNVSLGGFPGANKDFVCRRLILLDWRDPPPNCNLEGQGSILFNVFRMVQQIHFQLFTDFSIIVVPIESISKENCLDCGMQI